jgi:hypothetical protein
MLTDTETPKQPLEFFNIYQARELITEKYGRTFKRLLLVIPSQVTDGATIEFYDDEMHVNVATCKARYRNKICIDKQTGVMSAVIDLSDMSFGTACVNIGAVDLDLKQ